MSKLKIYVFIAALTLIYILMAAASVKAQVKCEAYDIMLHGPKNDGFEMKAIGDMEGGAHVETWVKYVEKPSPELINIWVQFYVRTSPAGVYEACFWTRGANYFFSENMVLAEQVECEEWEICLH